MMNLFIKIKIKTMLNITKCVDHLYKRQVINHVLLRKLKEYNLIIVKLIIQVLVAIIIFKNLCKKTPLTGNIRPILLKKLLSD
jgi:hypothetical protein